MKELNIAIAFVVGTCFGSFLNVCIHRIPRGISLSSLRSFCPNCRHSLRWFELIPLISFVFQRGRCRFCCEPISLRYPLVELLAGALFPILILQHGIGWVFLGRAILVSILIVIAFIDWCHLLIPNGLLLIGASGFSFVFLGEPAIFLSSIASGFGATTLLLVIRTIGNLIFKRESMGIGDIKLAGVIGLNLGFEHFLVALWIAAVFGSTYGLVIQRKYRRRVLRVLSIQSGFLQAKSVIPFGSFFSGGAIVVTMLCDNISELWTLLLST
jgi:leader peptidase (prepilin peptidase)/N-methyltransferase